jgi:predicted secreted hydrolase
MEAQELTGGTGGVSYWEGACDVRDEASGEIIGRAYLEMTGYADDIGRKLR